MKQDYNANILHLDVLSRLAEEHASLMVKGLTATIIEDFHDQPFGKSKPN